MLLTLTDIQNSGDLVSALSGIDIAVPARSNGRKTHHTETYIACRLLATLAATNRLTFPISVSRRDPPNDRPDVVMHAGNAQVGIEITEAIPKQFAALCALAEKEFPDHWLPVDLFPWDAEALSKDESRALLHQTARPVGGWLGDAPEREWALSIKRVVETKFAKLAKGGFQKFDQNWLAIYDNLPLPHVHLAGAIELLKPLLKDLWACVPAFDTLFIEHGPVIAQLTASESEHFVIRDLWQPGAVT